MATRFYLPSSGATPVAPAWDALWNQTSAVRRKAQLTKVGTAFTDTAGTETSTTADWDRGNVMFVSDPLQGAQTITGTLQGQIYSNEFPAETDAHMQLVAKVVSRDGTTVRGVLWAGDTRTGLVDEVDTAIHNHQIPAPGAGTSGVVTLTSVSALDGDRIVLELGARYANTIATSCAVHMYFGDSSFNDLTVGGSEATFDSAWIEFSQTLTIASPIVPRRFVRTAITRSAHY